MFAIVRRFFLAALAALLAASAMAQPVPDSEAPAYSQGELDSLLAPIALYPDPLLAQVLMAATYPLELVQAARWSRAHPDLLGEDAVRAVEGESWDASVKSLVAFPQLLQTMDERLGWTEQLGEAFLADSAAAMDTVQRLRRTADQRGNLAPSDEVVVQREGEDILIEPASPDTVYVPYYDPRSVYGDGWDAQYPPVYWAPWPGYAFTPGYAFGWTLGIPVGYSFFYGVCDWRGHHLSHREHRPFYYHGNYPRGDWHHDPRHRRGVAYHDPRLQPRFGNGQHLARPIDSSRRGYASANGATGMPNNGFFKPQVPGAPRAGLAAPDRGMGTPRGKPITPDYRAAQPGAPRAAPQNARPAYGSSAPRPAYRSQPSAPLARGYSPGPAASRAPSTGAPQYARPTPQPSPPAMPAAPRAMPSAPYAAAPSHAAAPSRAAPATGGDVARPR